MYLSVRNLHLNFTQLSTSFAEDPRTFRWAQYTNFTALEFPVVYVRIFEEAHNADFTQ